MSRPPLSPTQRSTVRRLADRGRTDRQELDDLLDEALVGHLGVVLDGAPVVIPTGFGRIGDVLYLHGSTGARSLREGRDDAVCFTVTLLDGVVYARSAFHHSMNYRSAVVHGVPRLVDDPDEKERALAAVTGHLAPGSWEATRRPTRRELAATTVLALDLTEASVKTRTGPPGDDEPDVAADGTPDGADWAGVLPVRTTFGTPETCPLLPAETVVPPRVADRTLAT